MSDILNLGGRVALVTGAGQGVGRQIALHLAAHNAGGLVVNDYMLDRAEKVADEIRAAGGRALAVHADVTDLESVKAGVKKGEDTFGKIGVLVNNAGNFGATPHADARKPFWETGPDAWNSSIGVNFYGVINCTSACVPGMIARGAPGRIITIISESGRYGDAGLEVYAGAKAGAAGFMRATARALGRYQITANCVAIAATETEGGSAKRLKEENPELTKKILEKYVIRRFGTPDDIANMVLFLASDASGWITGQTYGVNGGFTFGL
ncbi:SDR family NAD(P)-dependent oxidoreductase [Bradyrhizobium sp. BWA-3-5]|uniref:SDR family NAD(P)-dependent oxidoreductase n=1 Tax=Bradyrhizobium sp. BWA-3-5 TaxID=3080013 RepID=UPI00293EC7B0|nr:SDR family oxidoreductase [Bradyrhizobium sp. BWA-3-5]WOH63947.1 SDR family oxidoreductase [Bradyrhizobium sp. BWA-3-5]